LYVTAIPFFIALYQALTLINYIDHHHNVFSEVSVKALKHIKHCAVTIRILYVIGIIYLISQNAAHPGIVIIGLIIIFTSGVIAVFTVVLEKLLENAIDIKSENNLTI
jgi:membrane protein insertase Oxa1/YidC/SpoIIIJ